MKCEKCGKELELELVEITETDNEHTSIYAWLCRDCLADFEDEALSDADAPGLGRRTR